MGQTVTANGRSILHKGHGMTHVCAVPDVCKTPSPGGPIPIPYVNMAMDSDLTDGADSVKVEGNPAGITSSKLSTSTGDEAGSIGGIVSSKFKGSASWTTASLDVKADGKSVVRFLDSILHNGNTYNTSFVDLGGTGVAYGDDFDGLCPICGKGPKDHRVLEKNETLHKCRDIVERLQKEFLSASSDEQRQKYAKKEERKGVVKWNGYMVGVMQCKCVPGKLFAAMSGGWMLDGFSVIADQCGCKPIGGGLVTLDELASANTSANGVQNVDQKNAIIEKTRATMAEKFHDINTRRSGSDPYKKRGYLAPGNCAAAKLIGRSQHAPLHMTEMFFSPVQEGVEAWEGAYRWRRRDVTPRKKLQDYSEKWRERILQNKESRIPEDWDKKPFSINQTVASCHTCQETLFLALCPENTCK